MREPGTPAGLLSAGRNLRERHRGGVPQEKWHPPGTGHRLQPGALLLPVAGRRRPQDALAPDAQDRRFRYGLQLGDAHGHRRRPAVHAHPALDAVHFLCIDHRTYVDAFIQRVTYPTAATYLQTLVDAATDDAKLVLTSRAQHFRDDSQVRQMLLDSATGRGATRIVALEDFGEPQIRTFLTKLYGGDTAASLFVNPTTTPPDLRLQLRLHRRRQDLPAALTGSGGRVFGLRLSTLRPTVRPGSISAISSPRTCRRCAGSRGTRRR